MTLIFDALEPDPRTKQFYEKVARFCKLSWNDFMFAVTHFMSCCWTLAKSQHAQLSSSFSRSSGYLQTERFNDAET